MPLAAAAMLAYPLPEGLSRLNESQSKFPVYSPMDQMPVKCQLRLVSLYIGRA